MPTHTAAWIRRARPLLGTLVEVGVAADTPSPERALTAAFAAISAVQSALSRFEADSDIGRFHAMPARASLALRAPGRRVLRAAQALHRASGGVFDISLGSGPSAWACNGGRLFKHTPEVRLDLGGIAKGHAVDAAVQALGRAACVSGWVNAGGDLRVFGQATLPVSLRDEVSGGLRPLARLANGALATSHFAPGSRCLAFAPGRAAAGQANHPARITPTGPAEPPKSVCADVSADVSAHVSVAAPSALWADALTKIVAITGDAKHPLLARLGASAWLH